MVRVSVGGAGRCGAVVAAVIVTMLVAPSMAAADSATYSYTGSEQTFAVPSGVTSVTIEATGAAGGAGNSAIDGRDQDGTGGAADATATVSLPANTSTLYVEVGGPGSLGTGGFNGGGGADQGAGGGGASDVRTCSMTACPDLSQHDTRLVVAGGGGGTGSADTLGVYMGSGGAAGDTSVTGPGAGGGGDYYPDVANSGGDGGFGGSAGCATSGGSAGGEGGGGGGGYCGGGAGGGARGLGSQGGGGGGGSSYWIPSATNTDLQGYPDGEPNFSQVTISWTPPPDATPPTTSITLDPASPNGTDGAYQGTVGVSISGTDSGSGVAETRCVLDPATAPSSFDDLPSGQCAVTSVSAIGAHTIYAASKDNDGNKETPVTESLTIQPAAQSISFPATSVNYAQPDFSPATATSGLGVSYSDPSGQCALDSQGLVQIIGVGSCTVTASQPGNSNYLAAAPVTQTFTIKKAPLTMTAKDVSVVFGHTPRLGYTLSGFVNGDTASALTGHGVCSLAFGTSTDAGSYPDATVCLPGSLASPNYTIASGVPGTLTITPAPQWIRFTTRVAAPTYGGTFVLAATGGGSGNPVTFQVDSASGDGVCSITGQTLSYLSSGTCIVDAAQAGTDNYEAATRQRTIKVALAKLLVTADSQSRPAGTPNPPLTATISGFVDGQSLDTSGVNGSPDCTTSATPTSRPGNYRIYCGLGTLQALPGTYRFARTPGILTVTPQ